MSNKSNDTCMQCADGRNCINGRYCLKLRGYVTYYATPPCQNR